MKQFPRRPISYWQEAAAYREKGCTQSLKKQGILVRHFSGGKISDYVRITIWTKEQMEALVSAAERILNA